MEFFRIGNTEVPVLVKSNSRLKNRRLSVSENGVLVEGPKGKIENVTAFLEAKTEWIFSEWQKHKGTIRHSPWPEQFVSGAKVLFLGRFIPITVNVEGKELIISNEGETFKIKAPSGITQAQTNIIIKNEFIDYFSECILNLASKIASKSGFEKIKFRVTQRKDRWAYCDVKGNISLGWDLMFLPKPIVEYIIIHELVHSKIMNHSELFWTELGILMPDWRERVSHLKELEKTINRSTN
jgi:predicted metal-dependent hydrolase